jgi:hypothetical protein
MKSRTRAIVAAGILQAVLCGTVAARGDYLEDYATGCRALRFRSWGRAGAWFRKALDGRAQSLGAAVPWTGNNSIPYLPRYVLGVALYGSRRYDEAFRQWDEAEAEWSRLNLKRTENLELGKYRSVIEEGRRLYTRHVCSDIYGLSRWAVQASARATTAAALEGGPERARSLCEHGSFTSALTVLKSLRAARDDPPPRDDEPGRELPVSALRAEDLPLAFAKEVSDCEAPANRRGFAEPAASSSIQRLPPGIAFVGFRTSAAPWRLAVPSPGRRTVTEGGPSPASLLAQAAGVYSRKEALLIAPDYSRSAWRIAGSADAVAALNGLKNGLQRWGFRVDIAAGPLTAAEFDRRIHEFVTKYAPKGTKDKDKPALVWIHFIGHVYTPAQDENDSWMAFSDSPPVKEGDTNSFEAFKRYAVDLSRIQELESFPHHVVVSLESCAIGADLWYNLMALDDLEWQTAAKHPAFILVTRAPPKEMVSARQFALTTKITDLLQGCGRADVSGVMTGDSLFSALKDELRRAGVNRPQALHKVQPQDWRLGDIVLAAPADCRSP